MLPYTSLDNNEGRIKTMWKRIKITWNKRRSYFMFWFVPFIGAFVALGVHDPMSRTDGFVLFLIYSAIFAFYEKVGEELYDSSLSTFKPCCSHCSVDVVCPICSSSRVYAVCPECSSKKLPFE